jgi:hypothetical protein
MEERNPDITMEIAQPWQRGKAASSRVDFVGGKL